MIDHVLTHEQAIRLNLPKLTGVVVNCRMYDKRDLPTDLQDEQIAKDVYYQNRRIGGNLDLNSESR